MNDVMEKTLAGTYDPLPEGTSPEMHYIVTSLLNSDPDKRASSGDLLQMPICKLFCSGLMEIVQTQPSFNAETRAAIADQIAVVRSRNVPTVKLTSVLDQDNPSAYVSMTTVMEGAGPTAPLLPGAILFEGIVKKQSGDSVWKPRYLCIRSQPQLELILSITKASLEQQAIVTPFSELEDVFPVPPKYTGTNAQNVFAVAFKTGKRLSFQAPNVEAMNLWMERIQNTLGL
jgi:protein kinase